MPKIIVYRTLIVKVIVENVVTFFSGTQCRKLHARFRLVLKSTTVDDLEGLFCTPFQNTRDFQSSP